MNLHENLGTERKKRYRKPLAEDVWYDGGGGEWRWTRRLNPGFCLLHRGARAACGCPPPAIGEVFSFLRVERLRHREVEMVNRKMYEYGVSR